MPFISSLIARVVEGILRLPILFYAERLGMCMFYFSIDPWSIDIRYINRDKLVPQLTRDLNSI